MDPINLTLGNPTPIFPNVEGRAPAVIADADILRVSGKDFAITFSRQTGLISEGIFRGHRLLEGGPYLNLGAASLPDWWLSKLDYSV